MGQLSGSYVLLWTLSGLQFSNVFSSKSRITRAGAGATGALPYAPRMPLSSAHTKPLGQELLLSDALAGIKGLTWIERTLDHEHKHDYEHEFTGIAMIMIIII